MFLKPCQRFRKEELSLISSMLIFMRPEGAALLFSPSPCRLKILFARRNETKAKQSKKKKKEKKSYE